MPRVRLTGLFLFITAILLGLACAATRTSHIRFKQPDRLASSREQDLANDEMLGDGASSDGVSEPVPNDGFVLPPGIQGEFATETTLPPTAAVPSLELPPDEAVDESTDEAAGAQSGGVPEIAFVSVPIVYPLSFVGMAGLALWFAPTLFVPMGFRTRSRQRLRKRRNSGRRTTRAASRRKRKSFLRGWL